MSSKHKTNNKIMPKIIIAIIIIITITKTIKIIIIIIIIMIKRMIPAMSKKKVGPSHSINVKIAQYIEG